MSRKRASQRSPAEDVTSHFITDREVDMRILNPSTTSISSSPKLKHSHLCAEPSSQQRFRSPSRESKKPNVSKIPLSLNRVVSKKKIVSPSKSMKRKEHSSTSNKRRLQVLPLKISPRSTSKGKAKDKNIFSDVVQPNKATSKKLSQEKPWRHNMRFQSVDKAPLILPEDSCVTKNERKYRKDLGDVKEYMKSKSEKIKAQSREERIQSFQRKEKIKNRLEDLETLRKEKTPLNNDINKNSVLSPESKTTIQSHGTYGPPNRKELTKELHISSHHHRGLQGTNQLLDQLPTKQKSHKSTLSDDTIYKKPSTKQFNSVIKTSESEKQLVNNMSSKPDFLLSHAYTSSISQQTTSISEDTLSEGLLSTSLASVSKKSYSSSCAKDKSKAQSSTTNDSSRSKISINSESVNKSLKALPISTSDLSSQKCEDVKDRGVAEFVPSALHLRFLAELNQFETIQSAEKQIDKLERINDISIVRRDAATMAHIIKDINEASKLKEKKKKLDKASKRESRAEFEARIRKDINQLFHDKFMHLIESQTESNRVTANATKLLASFSKDILEIELQNKYTREKRCYSIDENSETLCSPTIKGHRQSINTQSNASVEAVSSQTYKTSMNVPEEVICLISKTESSIPEVLSVLEKASRSGDSIRQTISEVMSRRNEEDCPSSSSSVTLNTGNITEEIEKEISIEGCLTSPFELSPSQMNVEQNSNTINEDDNILNCSSSEFTLNMIEQHILVESRRANNQYILLKLKEKKVLEKATSEMTILDKEKKTLKLNNQDTLREKEIKRLKDKLKVAERERQFVLSQQRKILSQKKGMKELNVDSISDLESPEVVSNLQGKFIINDLSISSSTHSNENMIPKTLFSCPKDTVNSKASESFEESLTNISISSDHSDAAIRVNALKDELQRQKLMAKKLKDQQKVKNKESLQVQKESLKKQIETYDKLIVRIRDEITHQEVQTSSDVVPPQIKTPGSKSRSSSEYTIETEAISPDNFSLSSSSKVSTVISDHTINHNYKKAIDEKVVTTLCGSIFKTLVVYNRPINEIKSAKHSIRPQDLMLTTFDVDSEDSISEAKKNDVSTPNVISTLDDEVEYTEDEAANNDYIDDDFGLSSIRKESEELRQQQLLIEQEISRIHEESTTEIDKPPPPPYIMKTSNLRRRPVIKEEIYKDLNEKSLYEEPLQFLEALYDTLAERIEQLERNSANSKQNPPWMKQKPLSVIHKSYPLDKKGLLVKEILNLFGRGGNTQKDNLALRCLKKMKKKQGSNVEYILATELYKEEDNEWNNYDDEETRFKDALTSDIFDYLLKDTIDEINSFHIYDYLSYPIYALYYHPWRVRRYRRNVHSTVERKENSIVYEGIIQKLNPDYRELCKVKVDTMFGAFEYSVAKYGSRVCLGTREVFSEEEELQLLMERFQKYVMGAYKFMTYDELKEESYNLAEGFRSLKLPTKTHIAMFAETRKEWILTAYAAFINNFTLVTLYTNLGEDGVIHGINETEVKLVVCTVDMLPKIKKVIKSCPQIGVPYENNNVEFIMFRDLITRKSNEDRYPAPTPRDPAIIMYTSGSTGTPKALGSIHGLSTISPCLRIDIRDVKSKEDRIYKSVVDTMRRQGWAIEELFHYFVAYKMKWQDRGFDTPLLNKTLFRKVRYFIGGRVRLLISGGAPISHDTQSVSRTALCVPVLQGYGLTELTGGVTMSDPYDRTTCRVGPPLLGLKLKLVDWEEGNYTINDKPFPRGEIHCEDFYEEDGIRWFKTGDIGQMEADGVLKLVDRKKDLVKLSGGEYISYGKVESILKTCPIIENICTYADPLKDYLFAIVIPDKAHLNERGLTPEAACRDASFISSVTKEIGDYGLKNGLVKFEVPTKVLFVFDEWTTENGLITAAFKIRRKQVVEMYKQQIDHLYV
ncbi:ACSL [Lepeophtheirus salmonis]|uniref:long-chain-fatty-acid--CoA ligase n=1 Tax=Lepeophtheirus salmonis TaxID=72036 RepID=A0A7R8CD56_LEPSM|nr:ACSL [Lepeophtheirus salmonis]CAF2776413.1 ACSL [Lepeophtheirus salmonis]